jgi:hypothetical protein
MTVAMAAADTDQLLRRRTVDRHNIYLPYIREVGAMVLLAMVLYGVWDVIKGEGQLIADAVGNNTSAIGSLVTVQNKLLIHLNRTEATHAIFQMQNINNAKEYRDISPYSTSDVNPSGD